MNNHLINMEIPGLTSYDDLTTLSSFVQELKGQGNLVLEVGTFCGRTAYVLSKNSIPGTIILSIDHWIYRKVHNRNWGLDVDDSKRIFLETKRKYNLDNVIQVPKQSPLRRWNRKKINFLFLDGRHSFETVLSELNFYTQYCEKDAIIAGHDYYKDYPGVMYAVDCFAEENNYEVKCYPSIIWRLFKK